jgi:hypothetical protein
MNSGNVIFAIDLAGIALSLLSLFWQFMGRRNFKAADRRKHIEIARLYADNLPEAGLETAKSMTAECYSVDKCSLI